ncbi:hypothetical protein GCM10010293_40750 [Streptomyces griseoflavus]|uniref:hypothetical protein n=1 Tax=Streptomyces griseoflavus TaxID=35619 RepID=UPI0019988440|nr:hypothetical protein [Streptomyces griseoflavus]GGV37080.1 hypothetical protein GCM10010293_40750 [Streptomyces griseoflavus]
MRIRVSGERPIDAITVNGAPSRIVTVTAGLVSSVNGKTGGVTIDAEMVGADPAGSAAAVLDTAVQAATDAQAAAIETAAADATAKVTAHATATDPHGDRAWASGQFLPASGGTLTGGFFADLPVRVLFAKTTSTTQHAGTFYQAGTSGAHVSALNVVSDNPQGSAFQLSGKETGLGTAKISHLNPGPDINSDAGAAALSLDLKRNGMGGTAAQGIFVTATEGATTGNLIVLRNNGRDDFVVKGSGRAGVGMDIGEAPEASLEVKQPDTTTPGLVVSGIASTTSPLFQTKTSAGTATFEIGSSGAIVHRAVAFFTGALQLGSTSTDFGGSGGVVLSMKNATTAPSTNPTDGVIAYAQGGVFKVRSAGGVIFDTTRRTVTGAKGGNAALTSLLTQLATIGLITDNTT